MTQIGARTFLSANPPRWGTGGQECPRSCRLPLRRDTLYRRLAVCWTSVAAAASLACLIVLAGCTVGPDYKRPEATTIPAAYAGATNGWKVAQPQAQIPKGNWWEIFDDAELNGLEIQACRLESRAQSCRGPLCRGPRPDGCHPGGTFPERCRLRCRPPASAIRPTPRPGPARPSAVPAPTTTLWCPWTSATKLIFGGACAAASNPPGHRHRPARMMSKTIRLMIQAEVAADYFIFACPGLSAGGPQLQCRGLRQIPPVDPQSARRGSGLRSGRRPGADGAEDDSGAVACRARSSARNLSMPWPPGRATRFHVSHPGAQAFDCASPGSAGFALGIAGAPARHFGRRTAHGRRKRQHRRGQGRLFPDRPVERSGRLRECGCGHGVQLVQPALGGGALLDPAAL